MKPVFDNRADLKGKPACHALVVGVSDYPHIVGGSAPTTRETFEKTQLSSRALSAARLAEWLIDHRSRLAVPLSTCRVLASATPELLVHDEPVARATVENFVRAATEWAAAVVPRLAGHRADSHQYAIVFVRQHIQQAVRPLADVP